MTDEDLNNKSGDYGILIGIVSALGVLIIIMFVYIFVQKLKIKDKFRRKRVKELMMENRKRKYIIRKSTNVEMNNIDSIIKIDFLNNNSVNREKKSFSVSETYKDQERIIKLNINKFPQNFLHDDTINYLNKNKSKLTDEKTADEKSLSVISSTQFLILSKLNINKKKTDNNFICSAISGPPDKPSESNNISDKAQVPGSSLDLSAVAEENKCEFNEGEELEKIATIRLIENEGNMTFTSV
jgi:hypothetical protein